MHNAALESTSRKHTRHIGLQHVAQKSMPLQFLW